MKYLHRLFAVASAAFFIAGSALAQNAGPVTNHAYAIGKGAGTTGYTSLLCGSAQLAVGQAAADPICQTITGDVTISAAGVTAIGATKVLNSMLATMAANTTKCNATAGSAVPTDCTASTMRTNIGVVIGTNVQAWDADLDCIAANSTAGLLAYTGAGTCAYRTLTAPAAGFTITNPAGTAGNPTFVLANDLAALEGLASTGIARRTGTDAWSVGTLVTNAELATAGAATIKGNPTNATASVQDFTIQGLTARGAPDAANDKLPIYDNAAGTIKYVTPSQIAGASSGTVTSVTGNGVAVTTSGTIPPPFGIVNHSLAVSASAGALTIALKDNAGSDPSATSPVNGYFRNVTGATGSWTQLTVTSALSLAVSSGSTLGVTSSTAFRLWVVLFNDGGTARLGVINCSTSTQIYPLVEGIPTSSTAEGGAGAADSAGVIYTGTAVSSKAFLIVGYIEWSSTGLTAGTWTTTNLNFIQSFGPGIRKPGEPVQKVYVSSTTQGTFTGTVSLGAISSGISGSITPTSAANPIRAFSAGAAANSTGAATYVQLTRGASTLIGIPYNFTSAAGGWIPLSMMALDLPNTTSSTTYQISGKVQSASTGSYPIGTLGGASPAGGAILELDEIMG